MPKSAKRKAPSRVRYEQSNPTVSCRVTRDIYHRLQAAKQAEGKSFTDILKIGLGMLEPQIRRENEIRKKGHAEGYAKGYAEAEHLYKVTYFCSVCRKTITVTSEKEKEAITNYMQEHGWGHKECHERRQ